MSSLSVGSGNKVPLGDQPDPPGGLVHRTSSLETGPLCDVIARSSSQAAVAPPSNSFPETRSGWFFWSRDKGIQLEELYHHEKEITLSGEVPCRTPGRIRQFVVLPVIYMNLFKCVWRSHKRNLSTRSEREQISAPLRLWSHSKSSKYQMDTK